MKHGPSNLPQHLTAQCHLWKPSATCSHTMRQEIEFIQGLKFVLGLVWRFSRHVALDCVEVSEEIGVVIFRAKVSSKDTSRPLASNPKHVL